MDFNPGALVHVRNRDWVVLPSDNDDLILLKPLDGSDDDITGIFKPLDFPGDIPKPSSFPPPGLEDLGDFSSARLLFNAGRLSLRNAAGPFRSLGKLSFRPRAYQMVPLIMALRQEFPIRLLIADDVGVGKTIEALTVLKELLERGEIKRFAVITPSHLCDQWQDEIKDKFGIDPVIIRSNTEARLDREIPGDAPVFQYYHFQVISIDYIKSPRRMRDFVRDCPEFVIVDEAHTCSRHSTSKKSEQQRHDLIKEISQKKDQHLLLLTATPHSGKPEQFNSLLGLIDQKYINMDLNSADRSQRRELARYFVQRRRRDVEKWMGQDTPFPTRDSGEIDYPLSPQYADFYKKIHEFALGGKRSENTGSRTKTRAHYWSSLSLLHGVMSSPGAGVEMLNNRIKKREESDAPGSADDREIYNPLIDDGLESHDHTPMFGPQDWTKYEIERMGELKKELASLGGVKHDLKAKFAVQVLQDWLDKGFNPVVFCTFIATANYLGNVLKKTFGGKDSKIEVRVVTSEEPDEVRRERIHDMAPFKKKILVATDCLSEGINLQEQFNAVLHYDLPWNPNRLEQRDGRVDRYGQQKDKVKTFLLKSSGNPIDEAVYNVLLRKVREIHRATGIFVPFSGESILDAVLEAVMSKRHLEIEGKQKAFDFGDNDPFNEHKLAVSRQLDEAADREKESRSIFAQHAVKANDVEADLNEADRAIGSPDAVETFTVDALRAMGVQIEPDKKKNGYTLFTQNLPDTLKDAAPGRKKGVLPGRVQVSFFSPTPAGYHYIGRNHAFIEQLCRLLLADALAPPHPQQNRFRPARAAVLRSNAVSKKTTLLLLRVRNVIQKRAAKDQLVGEEMLAWGYRGFPEDRSFLDHKEVTRLMNQARASSAQGTVTPQAAAQIIEDELADISGAKPILDELAAQRAQSLVDAYDRFHKVVRGSRYTVSKPVRPMDIMGLYILLPEMK